MPKRKPDASPSFWGMARSFLHVHCERTRRMSPKTVEAYRIALECYITYLTDVGDVARPDISFDHFERQNVRSWATWMSDVAGYAPRTVALRLAALRSFLAWCGTEDVSLAALEFPPVSLTGGGQAASGWLANASSNSSGLM